MTVTCFSWLKLWKHCKGTTQLMSKHESEASEETMCQSVLSLVIGRLAAINTDRESSVVVASMKFKLILYLHWFADKWQCVTVVANTRC